MSIFNRLRDIFGEAWRRFLGVPKLAEPPDFSAIPVPEERIEIEYGPESPEIIIPPQPPRNPDDPGWNGGEDFFNEDSFIYDGVWKMTPASSNVYAFQYSFDKKILIVGYKGRRGSEGGIGYYAYVPMDISEARRCFNCTKTGKGAGVWVWDELRLRAKQGGGKCIHQKDYSFLGDMSTWRPVTPCPKIIKRKPRRFRQN